MYLSFKQIGRDLQEHLEDLITSPQKSQQEDSRYSRLRVKCEGQVMVTSIGSG